MKEGYEWVLERHWEHLIQKDFPVRFKQNKISVIIKKKKTINLKDVTYLYIDKLD